MKRNALLVSLAFLVAPLLASAADSIHFASAKASPAKLESTQTMIKGTSSLHEWQMEGSTINGALITDPETWRAPGERSANVTISIPVDSIKSDHSRMDRIMRDALKADKNPDITYKLASASLAKNSGDSSFIVHTNGKLTIAGATHDIAMDVTTTRVNEKRYILTGEIPIRMTDYGFKPPVAMLGTLKTGDDVKVSFRWVVERVQ